MMLIEFFLVDGLNDVHLRDENKIFSLEERSDIIDYLFEIIKCDYPDAYKMLFETYNKARNFKFLATRRFIKCNLSLNDSVFDINGSELSLENVSCPMRGECKGDGIICHAKISTSLSDVEKRIYNLLIENYEESEIADILYLSINTVSNHRKAIYRKLKLKSKSDLIIYHNKHYHNV